MRLIVLILAVLAGLKIWTQDQLYRAAMEDVLLKSHRERAIDACEASSRSLKIAHQVKSIWSRPAAVHLTIGRDADVAAWDFENPLWGQRFRHAYIVLKGSELSANATCHYDLTDNTAYDS